MILIGQIVYLKRRRRWFIRPFHYGHFYQLWVVQTMNGPEPHHLTSIVTVRKLTTFEDFFKGILNAFADFLAVLKMQCTVCKKKYISLFFRLQASMESGGSWRRKMTCILGQVQDRDKKYSHVLRCAFSKRKKMKNSKNVKRQRQKKTKKWQKSEKKS